MTKGKKKELIILFLYLIIINIIAFVLRFRYFEMALLSASIPGFYYLFKQKEYTKKIFIESILFTIPFTIIIEIFGHYNNAWYEHTIFSLRLFDLFPIESFLFGFNYYLFVTVFYKYFFDKPNKPKFNKNFIIVIILLFIALAATIILLQLNSPLLTIPYYYAVLLSFMFVFVIIVTIIKPFLFKRALLVSLYLIIPSLLHEYVSLELVHWSFEKGNHIGYIEFLNHTIPIEELIWLPLVPIVMVLFFEIFQDDGE